MATVTCPSCGAASATTDYCDSCGTPLAAASTPAVSPTAPPVPPPAPPADPCPNCGAARGADDAFCEGCGLDFASGQMPVAAPATPSAPDGRPSGWTAVVEADRAFFDSNTVDGAGQLTFPEGLAARRIPLTGDEAVIGRRSEAKGFFPVIDLSSPAADPGVSHRHAVLRRQADGSWAIVDDMSTNGTYLNGSVEPLDHGVTVALHDGDRLNLGSFTRITIARDAPQIAHTQEAP